MRTRQQLSKQTRKANKVVDPSRYPVELFYSEDDGGFIAIARDLPGCSAFGKTQGRAVASVGDAIKAWLQAANEAGNPIPEPTRHSDDSLPSGRLLLRIPRTLHASLIESAKKEGVSLNQHLVFLLSINAGALLLRDDRDIGVQGGSVATTLNTSAVINMQTGQTVRLATQDMNQRVFELTPTERWMVLGGGETIVRSRAQLNVRTLPSGQPILIEGE